MNQPITSQKLTKKFFFTLEPGLFLVSNVCHAPGVPVYVDVVALVENREKQWLEIKGARADGRRCDVFRSKQHYDDFRKAFAPHNLTPEPSREQVEDLLRRYVEGD